MIILNQLKYWQSSERVTQHSHCTLTTCAFYPHHATRAFEAEQWQDQRSDTAKIWGVGGEWVKPIFSQTRSLVMLATWLSIYQNWHERDSEDVDWFKLWKSLNYTLGHSYYYCVVSTPSFMPALMLISLSLNQSDSSIQQWVVLNWVTELTWLSDGSNAQSWHKGNDRKKDHSDLAVTWNHTLWYSLIISLNLSACCLPKEIAWPSFCPALSLGATEIGVFMQQSLLLKTRWLSFVSDKWPSSNPDFHSYSPGEAYKLNLYQKANSKAQISHQCLYTHRFWTNATERVSSV